MRCSGELNLRAAATILAPLGPAAMSTPPPQTFDQLLALFCYESGVTLEYLDAVCALTAAHVPNVP